MRATWRPMPYARPALMSRLTEYILKAVECVQTQRPNEPCKKPSNAGAEQSRSGTRSAGAPDNLRKCRSHYTNNSSLWWYLKIRYCVHLSSLPEPFISGVERGAYCAGQGRGHRSAKRRVGGRAAVIQGAGQSGGRSPRKGACDAGPPRQRAPAAASGSASPNPSVGLTVAWPALGRERARSAA